MSAVRWLSVKNMTNMFDDCQNLQTIYCNEDWQAEARWGASMFNKCYALKGGNGTALYKKNSDGSYTLLIEDYESYARPDEKDSPGLFTKKSTFTIGGYGVYNERHRNL